VLASGESALVVDSAPPELLPVAGEPEPADRPGNGRSQEKEEE
jgi:hypothetical protein